MWKGFSTFNREQKTCLDSVPGADRCISDHYSMMAPIAVTSCYRLNLLAPDPRSLCISGPPQEKATEKNFSKVVSVFIFFASPKLWIIIWLLGSVRESLAPPVANLSSPESEDLPLWHFRFQLSHQVFFTEHGAGADTLTMRCHRRGAGQRVTDVHTSPLPSAPHSFTTLCDLRAPESSKQMT